MGFGARPSNTRTREESDAQVAQALVAALGILRAEPLRITHVRDGIDFLMSGPGQNPFGAGGTGGPGGFSPPGGGGGGGGGAPGVEPEPGEPGQQGEQGEIGPQGPPGPAGPTGAPGPAGANGADGADASPNGFIRVVTDVEYDTSDQCLKYETTKFYGFFQNSGTETEIVGVTDPLKSIIACAEECDT